MQGRSQATNGSWSSCGGGLRRINWTQAKLTYRRHSSYDLRHSNEKSVELYEIWQAVTKVIVASAMFL
jgi:hypothetical protein